MVQPLENSPRRNTATGDPSHVPIVSLPRPSPAERVARCGMCSRPLSYQSPEEAVDRQGPQRLASHRTAKSPIRSSLWHHEIWRHSTEHDGGTQPARLDNSVAADVTPPARRMPIAITHEREDNGMKSIMSLLPLHTIRLHARASQVHAISVKTTSAASSEPLVVSKLCDRTPCTIHIDATIPQRVDNRTSQLDHNLDPTLDHITISLLALHFVPSLSTLYTMFSGDLAYIRPPRRRSCGTTIIELRSWPDIDKGRSSESRNTTFSGTKAETVRRLAMSAIKDTRE
ncbi:hypothetical protein BKA56DRAFT_618076 [Ilyonectria sp. MPI-CAGE-AT-0026]|nr:hypothetical protein BKA56DRAFT_618076 [Ilyonectria sp. MPI-CAGE-AT-0026]